MSEVRKATTNKREVLQSVTNSRSAHIHAINVIYVVYEHKQKRKRKLKKLLLFSFIWQKLLQLESKKKIQEKKHKN